MRTIFILILSGMVNKRMYFNETGIAENITVLLQAATIYASGFIKSSIPGYQVPLVMIGFGIAVIFVWMKKSKRLLS